MTQLSEAIARYHKILEGDHYKDLSWAHELQERMKARNLAVRVSSSSSAFYHAQAVRKFGESGGVVLERH
jgi:hypothetical protein